MTEFVEKSTHYSKSYGALSGKREPDFTRCCTSVQYDGNWPRYHQCERKRGFGPDQAYCKQHDPEVIKARKVARDDRDKANWQKRGYEVYGKYFYDVLAQIAEGHNDPRSIAQDAIDKMKDWRR